MLRTRPQNSAAQGRTSAGGRCALQSGRSGLSQIRSLAASRVSSIVAHRTEQFDRNPPTADHHRVLTSRAKQPFINSPHEDGPPITNEGQMAADVENTTVITAGMDATDYVTAAGQMVDANTALAAPAKPWSPPVTRLRSRRPRPRGRSSTAARPMTLKSRLDPAYASAQQFAKARTPSRRRSTCMGSARPRRTRCWRWPQRATARRPTPPISSPFRAARVELHDARVGV